MHGGPRRTIYRDERGPLNRRAAVTPRPVAVGAPGIEPRTFCLSTLDLTQALGGASPHRCKSTLAAASAGPHLPILQRSCTFHAAAPPAGSPGRQDDIRRRGRR